MSPKAAPAMVLAPPGTSYNVTLLRDRIMLTTKSIRESRRACRRPSARVPLTPSDIARLADSPRKPISPAVAKQYAAELAGSLVKLARLRGVTTTAFLALKHRNVGDVASTLQFSVVDPISSIEEDAWRIVASLGGEAPERKLL